MTANDMLDQVRRSCSKAADLSVHVKLDRSAIDACASDIIPSSIPTPEHDADAHYLNHDEDTAAFFLTLDAVNFGSGYFPYLTKRPGKSGYFTIATALKEYFDQHGPLTADQLETLTPKDCLSMFKQNPDSKPIEELMALFSKALNELGTFLIRRFDGNFINILTAADGSAENLVRILSEMSCFYDAVQYKGFTVYFFKRAQLAAADLHIAFSGKSWGRFSDMSRLTLFADNLVPHVLRVDGILKYSDDLASRIDSGELIPSASPEEIEIRACAVHAVELIKETLNQTGKDIASYELDFILWNRGQKPYYKARPRHRTRTMWY